LLWRHLVQHGVACHAGIVGEDVDGAEILLDAPDAGGARTEVQDVELVDANARFLVEFLRRGIIADVVGSNLVAGIPQRHGDGMPDSARSARHQCNALHAAPPCLPAKLSPRTCRPSILLKPGQSVPVMPTSSRQNDGVGKKLDLPCLRQIKSPSPGRFETASHE